MSLACLLGKLLDVTTMHLSEKYRPKEIQDFVGLADPKRILGNFVKHPYPSAWLFVGRSGSGKTAMATALAGSIAAKIHILPASDCTRANLDRLWQSCQSLPTELEFKRHLVLVDHADLLSTPQQKAFRPKLEGSEISSNIVWVFTAESAEGLDEGFSSRCHNLKFSTYGAAKGLASRLQQIWRLEASEDEPEPNFERIIKEANANMMLALNRLQALIAELPAEQQ